MGQLDNSVHSREAVTRKDSNWEKEYCPVPASRRMSSQGLQCPEETDASAPSASKQRIGAWGMSPRPGATRVRSGSQSVSTAYRGGELLCRSERQQGQHPSVSTVQVSTTWMRGIGLGLGGLDILTLEREE